MVRKHRRLEERLLDKDEKVEMWCYSCDGTTYQSYKDQKPHTDDSKLVIYDCPKCETEREYIVKIPDKYIIKKDL